MKKAALAAGGSMWPAARLGVETDWAPSPHRPARLFQARDRPQSDKV